jgi:3-oxoacyl-[acyl-carrier-protein] synthase-3
MSRHTRILATGSYLPSRVLSNHDLARQVDTSDEWIKTRTGITQRHIAAADESIVDMALQAAQAAMSQSDSDAASIDLIVCATATHQTPFPSAACLLQNRLGIEHCIAMDVSAACSGFMYAMQVADLHIKQGTVKRALIVGSEKMSAITDWQDRSTCVLFGDGAGAMILEASTELGIIATKLHSDARYHDLLYVDNSSPSKPAIKMQGNAVFKVAVNKLADTIQKALNENDLSAGDIDWLVPHQANYRIIKQVCDKVSIPQERVVITVNQHGNTSAASIPLAFDNAVQNHQIKRGHVVLMESFGAGFTWGSALVRF